ncbi:MAG: DnaJ domain-containing protein, partial [Bacteroidales bacterium]|nr:DnaJ domain-containing protein [Bacteroidales bacterium]
MQFLFGLAQADGHIDANEVNVIRNIALSIGIPSSTFESLKSMFMGYSYQGGYGGSYGSSFGSGYGYNSGSSSSSSTTYHNLDDDYKILEVSSDATNDEVKKAYRKLALEHHPDRVSGLGEDVKKAAKKK